MEGNEDEMMKQHQFQQKQLPPNPFPFYKENREAFRKRYPEYYKIVMASVPYPMEKSKTTFPNIKAHDLDYYNNSDPIAGVRESVIHRDMRLARLVVCLGYGLGYDPLFYSEQLSIQNNTEWMIIVEKDPAMVHTSLKILNLKPLIEQTHIFMVVGVPQENLFAMFVDWLGKENRYYNARAYEYIWNMTAMEDPYYIDVIKSLSEALVYCVNNYGNCAEDSIIGTENMMKNIPVILNNPGVNLLENKLKGIPAVVVATGPSLDKNKQLLKGIEDKALIISCDASLKILLEMGFKPHLVTTLEREMEIVKLFDGLQKEQVEDVYLMACPVVYPEVYATYPGPNIIIYRKFDHFKWLKIDRGMLDIKYSSGNMAFKIAEFLGCDPIILIGQDLALEGTKTNADGTTLGTEQESYLREEHMMVPANAGGMIETTHSLNLFLQAYNVDMKAHKGKCINATEGGAMITGTEVMTFREAIEKYVQVVVNPLQIIKKAIMGFVPDNDEGITARREHAIVEFERLEGVCKDGLESVLNHKQELGTELSDERIQEIMTEILTHKASLQKDAEVWQLLFAHVGQSYFLNFELDLKHLQGKYKTILEATRNALLLHEQYYIVMGGLMKVMGKMLKEA